MELCETEVLSLTDPTYGNECSTSKFSLKRIPPEVDFESSRSEANLSLGTIPVDSAVLYYPCDKIVCNHSCCDFERSYRPKVCRKFSSILWQLVQVCLRTKECEVHPFAPNIDMPQFESIFFDSSPTAFPILPFSSVGRPRHGVETLNNWFFACPSISEDQAAVCPCEFSQLYSCSGRDSWFEHLLVFLNNVLVRFAFTLSTSQIHVVKKRCRLSEINQLHQLLPHGTQILLSSSHLLWHPRIPIRIDLPFDARTSISNSVLLHIQVPTEFFTLSLPQGDKTDFVQEEPQGLRCLTKILATCVVEDVSEYLDILTLEASVMLKRLSFFLGCKLMLRRLLVWRNLVALQRHPWLFRPSFEMQTNPVLWMQRKSLNRLLKYHLGVQLDLCIVDTSVLSPLCWEDRRPSLKQKMDICFFCASKLTSFMLCTLVICHAGICSTFSHSLSTAASASGIFIAWGTGMNLCTRLKWLNDLDPFSAMWFSWSFDRVLSKRVLVDSWASTMHACFDFRILLDSVQVSLCRNEHCVVFSLQGIVASVGSSTF